MYMIAESIVVVIVYSLSITISFIINSSQRNREEINDYRDLFDSQ